MSLNIDIPLPDWGVPFLEPKRYKGLKGGRASAKSHFFAGLAVEEMLLHPTFDFVCLRESLKSLKFSAKKLIETKIAAYGVEKHFKILDSEIRRVNQAGETTGTMIFMGMQDHTAESIKSLEGFNRAWFEEASGMTRRSLELLRPTIREPGSEIWFSWNPNQETDPIEEFLVKNTPENAIIDHLTFLENPFCPEVIKEEARIWYANDPQTYGHVWLGEYNTKSDDQVLGGKWKVEEFEVDPNWGGPYYGADWGFSSDPNTVIECYIDHEPDQLYVTRELYRHAVEIEDTPKFFDEMKGAKRYAIRADNARPEMISHMRNVGGYHKLVAAEKWAGSVEDGISRLRSFKDIVIHPNCPKTAQECSLYKYKRDRHTDDILPDIIKKHDHCLAADTLVDTADGQIPIAELVGTTGHVRTHEGDRAYRDVRMTTRAARVFEVTMASGRTFKATADHMMLGTNGYRPVLSLSPGDAIACTSWSSPHLSASPIEASSSIATTQQAIMPRRWMAGAFAYISTYGAVSAARSRRIVTSIIKTATAQITQLATSNAFQLASTNDSIGRRTASGGSPAPGATWLKRVLPRRFGMGQTQAGRGIRSTLSRRSRIAFMKRLARSAGRASPNGGTFDRVAFAEMLARQLIDGTVESITSSGNVLYAGPSSQSIDIEKPSVAPSAADRSYDIVERIRFAGVEPVYNMEVETTHAFSIEGGLISHNCIDALRYAIEPFTKKKIASFWD